MIELTSLAYAAGLMDADGTIQIMRRKTGSGKCCHSVRASVSSTCEIAPNWLFQTFGGKIYKFFSSKERRQPVYRWMAEANKAKEFITLVLPYLHEKAERGKIALRYLETVQSVTKKRLTPDVIKKRQELVSSMSRLNSHHSKAYWKTLNLKEF